MDIFKELEKIYNELVILDFALKYLKILICSTILPAEENKTLET